LIIDRATVSELGSRIVYRQYAPEDYEEINKHFGSSVPLEMFFSPTTMMLDPSSFNDETSNKIANPEITDYIKALQSGMLTKGSRSQ